jgi:hypothetical protein
LFVIVGKVVLFPHEFVLFLFPHQLRAMLWRQALLTGKKVPAFLAFCISSRCAAKSKIHLGVRAVHTVSMTGGTVQYFHCPVCDALRINHNTGFASYGRRTTLSWTACAQAPRLLGSKALRAHHV